MVRQTAATIRLVTVILLLTDSLELATAHENATTSILLNTHEPLYAGRSYEIVCRVVGWMTPPKMFWWLGDQPQLHIMKQLLTSEERNESVSILLLTPSPDDNGLTLKCRSEGTYGIQEESVDILVFYPPTVSLYVVPPLRADDIREGDDVSLQCHVQSNPPVWRVQWLFQGRLLQEADFSGPRNESLTLSLKSIDHTQAGNYSCVVSNAVGDAESLPLQLKVKYEPVCRHERPLVYFTTIGEVLELDCGGESFPPPDSYRWVFSRALHSEVQPTQWRMRAPNGEKITYLEWATGVSWRDYQVREDLDYGTFYCSAKNGLGLQHEPCVFFVVPPGKPEAPTNCSVLNETTDSFMVQCPTTTDGGFRLGYQLEVFDGYTGHVKFNVTQKPSTFLVGGLEPNRTYTMRVAAVSPRGQSEWFRMNSFTQDQPPTAVTTTTMDSGEHLESSDSQLTEEEWE